jgi:hypothetical protein
VRLVHAPAGYEHQVAFFDNEGFVIEADVAFAFEDAKNGFVGVFVILVGFARGNTHNTRVEYFTGEGQAGDGEVDVELVVLVVLERLFGVTDAGMKCFFGRKQRLLGLNAIEHGLQTMGFDASI